MLQILQVPTISEHMRDVSDVHLAVDLIQFSETVSNAVLHAVGNSLVAETLEAAKKYAFNDKGRRFKVASLDGTLIAVNGSMSGGQTRSVFHHTGNHWSSAVVQISYVHGHGWAWI